MRAKLQQWIYKIRGSYWFMPALMTIAAIVLSQMLVELDRNVGADWMTDLWWASLNQPEGARALLATVAGSMITVAGVTFSLTILAVSYGTSHFGPRLLDNFMRDRGNQLTLGTFLATFLYCLLVLRTVRSGTYSSDPTIDTTLFVPHLSILLAIVLTLCSVGVLIFFIHHIPESMHISNVLDQISTQMTQKIDELYPETLGVSEDSGVDDRLTLNQESLSVACQCSGYLQGVDETELIEFTQTHNAIVELLVCPGDFLLVGQPIARVICNASGQSEKTSRPDSDSCARCVDGAMAIGVSRTPTQDLFFVLNQFIEIAARALSPGVNDPFTAMQCIDQLGNGFVLLSGRTLPSRYRYDEDGNLRVVTTQPTWKAIVDRTFVRLLPYVLPDPNVKAHLIETIERVCEISSNQAVNQLLNEFNAQLRSS